MFGLAEEVVSFSSNGRVMVIFRIPGNRKLTLQMQKNLLPTSWGREEDYPRELGQEIDA